MKGLVSGVRPSSGDPTRLLEEAGVDLFWATAEQRRVLATLSEEEVRVLISVKQRLGAVAPDLEPHMAGGVLW